MKCKQIIKHIDKLAPRYLAEEWDNVGLLIGDSNSEVSTIMVALDASPQVINEAIEKNVDMLVTHHPMPFKALKRITTDEITGRKIIKLIQNKISLYSTHTNLDIAFGGTNDVLAEMLNLQNVQVLSVTDKENEQGIGRVGLLNNSVTLKEFAEFVKKQLNLSHVRMIGEKDTSIKKIALCTGSGMQFLKDVLMVKADVYLTSDIRYHDACDAVNMGICLIDAGHYGTEVIIVPKLKKYIQQYSSEIKVIESEYIGEPFYMI